MDAGIALNAHLNGFCLRFPLQALGQQPLTFHRQVLSLCMLPQLLDIPAVIKEYPPDAVERAKAYLHSLQGDTYTYGTLKSVIRGPSAGFLA